MGVDVSTSTWRRNFGSLVARWPVLGSWDAPVFVVGLAALAVVTYLLFQEEPVPGLAHQGSGDVIAQLEEARNNVRSRPAAVPAWDSVTAGKQLRRAEHVFTGDKAMADIAFINQTRLTVEENSLVVLEMESASSALDIRRGLVYIVSGDGNSDVAFTVNGVKGKVKAGNSEAVVRVAQDGSADVTVVKGLAVVGNTEILSRHTAKVAKSGEVSAPTVMALTLGQPAWNAEIYVEPGSSVEFSWNAQIALKDLRLEIAQDSMFATILRTRGVDGTSAAVGDLPLGEVFWRVSGVPVSPESADRTYSDARRINFIGLTPPKSLKPLAGEVLEYLGEPAAGRVAARTEAKVIFDWVAPFGARAVELEVLDSQGAVVHAKTVDRPPYLMTGLADGTYGHRLRTHFRNARTSPWSGTGSFVVKKLSEPLSLVPVSPADGARVLIDEAGSKAAAFRLDGPLDTKSVQLQIGADPEFRELLEDRQRGGLAQKWTPPKAGTYWWRARSEDVYGRTSAFTAARRLIAVTAQLELDAPQASAELVGRAASDAVTFRWRAFAGARQYHLEVAADQTFGQVWRFDTTATEWNWSPPGSGTFYWRVAADLPDDGSRIESDPRPFTWTIRPKVLPPTLTPKSVIIDWGEKGGWNWPAFFAPVAYAETGKKGRARITWPAVENAKGYHLQVAKDREFHVIVLDERTEQTSYDWQGPEARSYFYRVAAIDAEGEVSAFSNVAPLDVSYPAPRLLQPRRDTKFAGAEPVTVRLRWKGVPGIDRYVAEVSASASFAETQAKQETGGGAVDVKLATSGVWYWRVKALADNGEVVATSATQTFSTVIAKPNASKPAPEVPPKPAEPVPAPEPEAPPPTGYTFLAAGMASSTVSYELESETTQRTIEGKASQTNLLFAQWWPGEWGALAMRVRQWSLGIDGTPVKTVSAAFDGGVRLALVSSRFFINPYLGYESSEILLFQRNLEQTSTAQRAQRVQAGLAGTRFSWHLGRFALRFGGEQAKALPMAGFKASRFSWTSAGIEATIRLVGHWALGAAGGIEKRRVEGIEARPEEAAVETRVQDSVTYVGGLLGFLF